MATLPAIDGSGAMHPPSNSSLTTYEFKVDRQDIGYVRFTLESYDGMAVVSTRDPYTALIEVSVSPGCEEMVMGLLASLSRDEGLAIEQVSSSRSPLGHSLTER